jgi:hypothetical protein
VTRGVELRQQEQASGLGSTLEVGTGSTGITSIQEEADQSSPANVADDPAFRRLKLTLMLSSNQSAQPETCANEKLTPFSNASTDIEVCPSHDYQYIINVLIGTMSSATVV